MVFYWNSNESVKCPVGALARHEVLGWVTVVGSAGWERTVETYHYHCDKGADAEQRAYGRAIHRREHKVDVRDLQRLPRL